jgi:hypothetical protein
MLHKGYRTQILQANVNNSWPRLPGGVHPAFYYQGSVYANNAIAAQYLLRNALVQVVKCQDKTRIFPPTRSACLFQEPTSVGDTQDSLDRIMKQAVAFLTIPFPASKGERLWIFHKAFH